ncbi:hypothetical protein JCM10207_000245, partial [Rhodosporidiobolus poonsookiae]
RPDVIKALHAEDGNRNGKQWSQCSGAVAAKFWTPNSVPAVMLLPELLEQMPILLYHGDQDLMCAGIGVEKMIEDLEWNGATGFNDSVPLDWTVNGEFAGLWQTARNLTYVEVFNSSHMVPMDKPLAAHDMLLRFMQVDTLNSAGSHAKIPSSLGSELPSVLGATHPNGSTLAGASSGSDLSAADGSAPLGASEGKGTEAATMTDGFDPAHERYYGPRRTAALVVVLVAVVGIVWAVLRWRTGRRRERYRRLKGKGRAVRLEERSESDGERGMGAGRGFRDEEAPPPRPVEAETVAVFDVGEEDSEEDEDERGRARDSYEKSDEEAWGDLGKAAETNPWMEREGGRGR